MFENSAIGVALTDLNGCFLTTNHVLPVYGGLPRKRNFTQLSF